VRPVGNVRALMRPSEIIRDGVLRALTWKPARFSTSYDQNKKRGYSRAQLTAEGVIDEDADPAFLFRRLHCCARTDWHADRTSQSADQGMQCFAIKDARALVLAPDRRTKMLVRRQDHDLEITVAVADEDVGAGESRPKASAGNRRPGNCRPGRHGEAQRSIRSASAAA